MKLRLETTFYPSEDAYIAMEKGDPVAPSREIAVDIAWPFMMVRPQGQSTRRKTPEGAGR